jgi:hypothetical protein
LQEKESLAEGLKDRSFKLVKEKEDEMQKKLDEKKTWFEVRSYYSPICIINRLSIETLLHIFDILRQKMSEYSLSIIW